MSRTPLEEWISRKIGLEKKELTREVIAQYQLARIREVVALVKEKSAFYRKRLSPVNPDEIGDYGCFSRLPFTFPRHIREDPQSFVCKSQGEIERIVTLRSSGTTGPPKRIYFTKEDQELTIDFFKHGMKNLAGPADRVMILLPGQSPGSVGDLLRIGLERMGAYPLPYGPVYEPDEAIKKALRENATAMVGIPTHLLRMARHREGALLKGKIKSVLLATDYVSAAICRVLERRWGCRVYSHYGMTEMGLGGGVQCGARAGYHLREADLFFEIVDPVTGEPLPEGALGEIVFTTLTGRGMPLIRYRTGDLSRFIPGRCACGTVLRSMDLVRNRLSGLIGIEGRSFSISDLDERLFPLCGILDYRAGLKQAGGIITLCIDLKTGSHKGPDAAVVLQALLTVPALKELFPDKLQIRISHNRGQFTVSSGTVKRRIMAEEG